MSGAFGSTLNATMCMTHGIAILVGGRLVRPRRCDVLVLGAVAELGRARGEIGADLIDVARSMRRHQR